jgi:hypothetical protein
MPRSKTVGRVVFFGLGYLAGTRAGRERYAQIEAGLKAVIEMLRALRRERDEYVVIAIGTRRIQRHQARRLIDGHYADRDPSPGPAVPNPTLAGRGRPRLAGRRWSAHADALERCAAEDDRHDAGECQGGN